MSKKLIILSEQKSYIKKGSSAPQVDGQERAFLKYGNGDVDIKYKSIILKNINRITGKLHLPLLRDGFTKKRYENSVFIFISVNLNYLEENAYLLKELKRHGNEISLYNYDCWEPEFEQWRKVIDEIDPEYLFFAYKLTDEYYKKHGYNSYWVPLSADYEVFNYRKLEKTRLFMQMGRFNQQMHNFILNYLDGHGLEDNRENYAYRRNRNETLYPDYDELVNEINKTKYFVCVPKYYENFARTGNVNDIICRYFEAMICKTLVIGKKPETWSELFSYDAMLTFEEDGSDFDKKIDYYENHPEEYQQLVDKNYDYILKHHSWGNRLQTIMKAINDDKQKN